VSRVFKVLKAHKVRKEILENRAHKEILDSKVFKENKGLLESLLQSLQLPQVQRMVGLIQSLSLMVQY
jgi:hypothetical protein